MPHPLWCPFHNMPCVHYREIRVTCRVARQILNQLWFIVPVDSDAFISGHFSSCNMYMNHCTTLALSCSLLACTWTTVPLRYLAVVYPWAVSQFYITCKWPPCVLQDYLQRCNGKEVGKFRYPGGMDKTHRRKIIGFLQDNLWIGAS